MGGNEGAGTPKWRQVAADLRGKIASGELAGQLEGERRLAMRYEVSRDTAAMALLQLEREGLIKVAGHARFVVPPG